MVCLSSAQNHTLWVLIRSASLRCLLMSADSSCYNENLKKKKIKNSRAFCLNKKTSSQRYINIWTDRPVQIVYRSDATKCGI